MKELRVIVAGSRGFEDYNFLEKKLNFLFRNYEPDKITIISGTADGPDRLGEIYANKHHLRVERYPADWDRYGKSAGYKRNQKMAEVANALVAFWDGKSKGTKHMINIAREKKLKIKIVKI